MPRKLRLQYPGAMYQVMSQGDRGERIFLDDVDRHDFMKKNDPRYGLTPSMGA